MKPKLIAPGTKRLKQKKYHLLSSFAFNFNLRRFTLALDNAALKQSKSMASGEVAVTLHNHTRNERAQLSKLDHDLRDALFAAATKQLPRMSARDLQFIAVAADGISNGQFAVPPELNEAMNAAVRRLAARGAPLVHFPPQPEPSLSAED